ncbi:MAG: tRNA (adenosine(37)-N6)-threonylcarbamoyltransferase complex ATPase subunit type 1 TsaE [Betaproteobacteria bacterium RIFCSPLOWO2_02_64_14]|nr:MAG: tRNA (adenosine(37)-N6)-threonylcarbamoyltransferase complex ATPase subunit type 1 TsaE [Betaproteobacteria bacterium RIFCSPLOWO2_02_64_14]
MHSAHHKPELTLDLPSEADTLALGAGIARGLAPGMVVFLSGELGAGKTTLARGILRGLGHTGRIKSPSFTLVEVYKLSRLYLYHFDFYRFNSPMELEDAGFREIFDGEAVCLVEWPEKAGAALPAADLKISIRAAGTGRRVEMIAATEAGKACLRHIPR